MYTEQVLPDMTGRGLALEPGSLLQQSCAATQQLLDQLFGSDGESLRTMDKKYAKRQRVWTETNVLWLFSLLPAHVLYTNIVMAPSCTAGSLRLRATASRQRCGSRTRRCARDAHDWQTSAHGSPIFANNPVRRQHQTRCLYGRRILQGASRCWCPPWPAWATHTCRQCPLLALAPRCRSSTPSSCPRS